MGVEHEKYIEYWGKPLNEDMLKHTLCTDRSIVTEFKPLIENESR